MVKKIWILIVISVIAGCITGVRSGWAVGMGSLAVCGLVGCFGYILIEGAREYAENWGIFLGIVVSCGLLLLGGYALLVLVIVAGIGYMVPDAMRATGDSVAMLYISLALGIFVLDSLAVLKERVAEKASQITGI